MNFLKGFIPVVLLMAMQVVGFAQPKRYLGGDVSLLPSYEQTGTIYRDFDGKPIEPLVFFSEMGWNAIRVRLFVNPEFAPQEHKEEGVCQDLKYALNLSKRVKDAGFDLLLDIHYSDYWADPSKQTIPHLWENVKPESLSDSVYAYTSRVLSSFKAKGVVPDMIQVGNEITFGMLWPVGRIHPMKDDNWSVLCKLLSKGCKACREVCPEAKIVIHTERAGEWDMTRSFYMHLQKYCLDYDIIGLSYYPMWHNSVKNLGTTLNNLEYTFPGKEVMIVETAAYYSHENDKWATGPDQYAEFYQISPKGQASFVRELMKELSIHKNVTGVFWWFPEENACGNVLLPCWINRGLFDNHTGKALPALKEFKYYK